MSGWQKMMWDAVHRGNPEHFDAVLWQGADPDNKEARKSNDMASTVLDCIYNYLQHDEETKIKLVELCFDYGANWDDNKQLHYVGYFFDRDTPKVNGALLTEIARYEIQSGRVFIFPIDKAFGGVGDHLPGNSKDHEWRTELADKIHRSQHAFVDYVATSPRQAAEFLRGLKDHPTSDWWLKKMDFPDHNKYSRPSLGLVNAVHDLAALHDEYDRAVGPGAQELRRMLKGEMDDILDQTRHIQRSWKP